MLKSSVDDDLQDGDIFQRRNESDQIIDFVVERLHVLATNLQLKHLRLGRQQQKQLKILHQQEVVDQI